MERNIVNGRGVYLFTLNPSATLKARVPGVFVHLDRQGLTIAPAPYQGVGASSAEVLDMLRWSLETGSKLTVSTGHYGTRELASIYEELGPEEINKILDSQIPATPAGLMVYTALRWSLSRETMFKDLEYALNGYGNDSWEASGVGPKAEDIRGLATCTAVADVRIALLEAHNKKLQEKLEEMNRLHLSQFSGVSSQNYRLERDLVTANRRIEQLVAGIHMAVDGLLNTRIYFASQVLRRIRQELEKLIA